MADADVFVQIGRMVEAHGCADDAGSNMALFKEAGLIDFECDASLTAFDIVLRTLAKRLRAGDVVASPLTFPQVREGKPYGP